MKRFLRRVTMYYRNDKNRTAITLTLFDYRLRLKWTKNSSSLITFLEVINWHKTHFSDIILSKIEDLCETVLAYFMTRNGSVVYFITKRGLFYVDSVRSDKKLKRFIWHSWLIHVIFIWQSKKNPNYFILWAIKVGTNFI